MRRELVSLRSRELSYLGLRKSPRLTCRPLTGRLADVLRDVPARNIATTHPSMVMPTVRGLHDPAELALYGLPEGVWAWLIEPDVADLAARGVEAGRYAVTVVGIDSWSGGPDAIEPDVDSPDARMVTLPGLVKFDVRYLSVRLLGTPAELVWLAPWGVEPRLDLLRVQGLKKAQVVELYQARRLVDLDWGPLLGRPLGDTDWSPEEFEKAIGTAVAEMLRNNVRVTQGLVADEIRLNKTTLRKYLKRAGVDWRSVVKGEWPSTK
jgi:hypothetical protein